MGITNAGVIEELIRQALLSELEPSLTDDARVRRLLSVADGDVEALTRAATRVREINRERPSFLGLQAAEHLDLARTHLTDTSGAMSA